MQINTVFKISVLLCFSLLGLIDAVRQIKKWIILNRNTRFELIMLAVLEKETRDIPYKQHVYYKKRTMRKKRRFFLTFAGDLLICGITMCLAIYFIRFPLGQSSPKMPISEGSTSEAETSETIEVIIETLNEENKLEQHSLVWGDIIENRLALPSEIIFGTELEAIRMDYQNQIGVRLFSSLPPFEDIYEFAMIYGHYFGMPDKSDYSLITLDQERTIIDQQIRDTPKSSGCSFELYGLYKEELAIRLTRMLNGYNNIDAYWTGVAAQNVFEKGYAFMSLGEALFYLILASDLYNLSLQYSPDSYVLYKQCEVWLKLSRLDWHINGDEATEFVEKYQLQLLLISDAYGSLSINPYENTIFAESKKYLHRYLGEIFWTLDVQFNMIDTEQLALDYLDAYLSEIEENSDEYTEIENKIKYLDR